MKNAELSVSSTSPEFVFERNDRFSPQEELANALSHGLGIFLSLIGLISMLLPAVRSGESLQIVSCTIFGFSMLAVYISSTMTHALPPGRWKDRFHNIDQIAIYILIAGTYTPFALITLREDWGWLMFGLEWALAFSGIMMKLLMPDRFEKGVNILIIASYVIMGWLLLAFLLPLYRNMDPAGIGLIFLGGVFYSLGIVFFKSEKLKYHHLIWHIMVISGSVVHWWAVMRYVLMA